MYALRRRSARNTCGVCTRRIRERSTGRLLPSGCSRRSESATGRAGTAAPYSSAAANSFLQADLTECVNFQEIEETLQAFLRDRQIPPGEWVTAQGYDQNALEERSHPTLALLDRAAPENPLLVQHKSGHMGVVNTQGLKRLGITPQTQPSSGGAIGVKDECLTGYLEENAFVSQLRNIPLPSMEQLLQGYRAAQDIYAAQGITLVQDGMVTPELLPAYRALLRQDWLKLDVAAYTAPEDYAQFAGELPRTGHLTLSGMKIFLDGSPQGRTAWMRAPYADDPGYRGYGTMTDEAVTQAMIRAGEARTQLLCHCNGDAAAEQFLRCLEAAERACHTLKALRPVIIHGQLMGRDQLETAARLGAVVSFFVGHVYHWGDLHRKTFGPERAAAISPARSALDAGVPVTLHNDAPVIAPNLLETLWCAVNRRTRSGFCLGPEERLTPEAALVALTKTAAWQYFQERERGTLEPGKRADLVVLSRNPLAVSPEALRDIQVLQTWKDGTLLYSAP